MCRSATVPGGAGSTHAGNSLWVPFFAAAMLIPASAAAQSIPAPDWRHIGNGGIDAPLASPGAGPVLRAWFAPDGSVLFVRTASGHVFETSDREKWRPATAVPPPVDDSVPPPPPGAGGVRRSPAGQGRLYAFGDNLFRSDDGGASWKNLTAFRNASVIGGGMHDVAVSPADGDEVVVANDVGLWRSMDGGVSWIGLNETLPNLPVKRFSGLPQTALGVRIVTGGFGVVEWAPGEKRAWRPVGPDESEIARRAASQAIGAEISATAAAGDYLYAGGAGGQIWVSTDAGRTWNASGGADHGAVESIWVDPQDPRVALAALAATKGPRVLRTVNGGQYWDDITSGLPGGAAHGVTADRDAGAVYAATDSGVFMTQADLNSPAPARPWTQLAGLPEARALDVRLDPGGNQLFVALEGYGVYAAMAPHRYRSPKLVNAADFSSRPAAPGSLLSLLGRKVTGAQANGVSFPVLATSDSESQIQVPFNVDGRVSLALETAAGPLNLPLPVRAVSPAIFVDRDGTPLVLNADNGVLLDGMNPARSNYRLQILATGLGAVRPEWPAGRPGPAQDPPEVVSPVRAFLDRSPVEVTRAVLAPGYIGLYLVEVQLPPIVNAGSAELYIEAGAEASNRVHITIEP